jgi:glutaredoxin
MPVKQAIPSALLLTAPGCPHCPGMKRVLDELLEEGLIAELESVDIAQQPERAATLGARSVPWLKLGELELEGLHSIGELRGWARHAATPDGLGVFFTDQLKSGRLPKVMGMVRQHPHQLDTLLRLASDPETELTVRIGISAVVEDLAGSDSLLEYLPALDALGSHNDPRVRADACHFLALTQSELAVPVLERMITDSDRSVRDVATDSLKELRETLPNPATTP